MSDLHPVSDNTGDDDHRWLRSVDGMQVIGWPCPHCGCREADVLHLEPPYGALVRCRGTVTDDDWGVPRPCVTEYPIAF